MAKCRVRQRLPGSPWSPLPRLPSSQELEGPSVFGSKSRALCATLAWAVLPQVCRQLSAWRDFPLINSQTKHMFPSRPPSHLPLGKERTSAQFLAGSTDRRPSAPEEPAWINTAKLCLPRLDQPGQAGGAEALGLRPQTPGVTLHAYLAMLAAPGGAASLENGRRDTGKESSLQDSAHLPGHFLKSLPAGPRVTAPSHLPSPHSRPHQAICHPGPPGRHRSLMTQRPALRLLCGWPLRNLGGEGGAGKGA